VIVGRLIPAGTGSVMNRIKAEAAERDRELAEKSRQPSRPPSRSRKSRKPPTGLRKHHAAPQGSGRFALVRAIVAPTAAILTQRHKMFTRAPGANRADGGVYLARASPCPDAPWRGACDSDFRTHPQLQRRGAQQRAA
jgi:hypothetical protein